MWHYGEHTLKWSDPNHPLYKTYAHLMRSSDPFAAFCLEHGEILQGEVRRHYSASFHRYVDGEDFAQEIMMSWWGACQLYGPDEAANMTRTLARNACQDYKRRIRAEKRGGGQELTFSQAGISGDEDVSRVVQKALHPSGKVPRRAKSDGPTFEEMERRAYERIESVGLSSTSAQARRHMMASTEKGQEQAQEDPEEPLWYVPEDLPSNLRAIELPRTLATEELLRNEYLSELSEDEAYAFLEYEGIFHEPRTQKDLAKELGVTPRTIRNRVKRAKGKLLQAGAEPAENGAERLNGEKSENG